MKIFTLSAPNIATWLKCDLYYNGCLFCDQGGIFILLFNVHSVSPVFIFSDGYFNVIHTWNIHISIFIPHVQILRKLEKNFQSWILMSKAEKSKFF